MTKRIYFDNPYQIEFEGEVTDKLKINHKIGLILNQTCFYPESGGQPSDKGTINGINVTEIYEKNDEIIHLLEQDILDKKVKGKIDWFTRFDHMQQHSGQHILSQSFVQVLEAETLSFHLGETVSTIEVDLRGISEQDIEKIERLANQIIYENREIKTYFVTLQQAEKLKLRKPPQKQEEIRIVEISDFDISACGGTHCQNTGEIGIIKIKKWEKIRNNLRFEFLCGQRALKDYFQKNILVNRLSTRFSVKDEELSQAIDRLYDDFKTQRKKVNKLQEKLIEYEAKEIAQKAEGKIIKIIFSDREVKEVKYLALNIIKQGDFVALLGLKSERVYLFLARSETLSFDMREIVDLVAPIIEGRGGGSASFVEIGGEKKENLTQALEKAYQLILNRKL